MKCSICRELLLSTEAIKTCEECKCSFHLECWNDNGGCGTTGCPNLPEIGKRQSEELKETTYWGATTKICPMCGENIKVSKLVCPYCEERFETIDPIGTEEIKERFTKGSAEVKGKKGAIIIFICGLLGITAPFNLLFGGIWYQKNRKKLREASPIHYFLATVGLSVSAIYSLLILISILSH